jgi:uncharacterized lipoprotein
MNIGSADSKRADTGPPWMTVRGPFHRFCVDIERGLRKVDLRVRPAEVEARRETAVPKREHCLDQAGDSSRGIEMADIGFD